MLLAVLLLLHLLPRKRLLLLPLLFLLQSLLLLKLALLLRLEVEEALAFGLALRLERALLVLVLLQRSLLLFEVCPGRRSGGWGRGGLDGRTTREVRCVAGVEEVGRFLSR